MSWLLRIWPRRRLKSPDGACSCKPEIDRDFVLVHEVLPWASLEVCREPFSFRLSRLGQIHLLSEGKSRCFLLICPYSRFWPRDRFNWTEIPCRKYLKSFSNNALPFCHEASRLCELIVSLGALLEQMGTSRPILCICPWFLWVWMAGSRFGWALLRASGSVS